MKELINTFVEESFEEVMERNYKLVKQYSSYYELLVNAYLNLFLN